ncbi:hypothetical protein DCE79_11405 [Lysinibacillus sp. 2017]|uniref:hypothetical protein n=1 Tax=unclassified Lysinibacillus TaxID=2636778 RepID=UPI000D527E3E|nr:MULTISPECIES: hypothetical protein [unclassified Lysinibacillus]AWE07958.1 hypothetical protein DCE79_11405 [Lysinibacillus sp. 2017]TGN29992.1 hypothetical protein E4L99_17670 [Lysinibacillus sp. S2017]
MRTFGILEGNKPYLNRVAAYGVILNASQNKVAIIRNEKNDYFLPGGGLEEHFVVWEEIHEAIRKLIFDHHCWAVQEAIK